MNPKMKIQLSRGLWLGAVLTMCVPAVVQAQAGADPAAAPPAGIRSLTFAEAQRYALSHNPELLAIRRIREAAEGRRRQAGVYRFNPEFTFESEQVGSGRTLRAYEGEVSQEVEWAGQWGLRKRAASHDVAAADATVRDAERVTRARAASAYYDALAAQSRVALAESILLLNTRLAAAVADLLEAGSISLLEANLAEIESGRARARVLEERRNGESALLELRRVLGVDDDEPLSLSSDVPDPPEPSGLVLDSLVRVAMQRRPDLQAAGSRIEVGSSLVSLARRERLPNLRLTMPFDRLEGPGSGQVGIGVGISIPLWNRNQGTVAELQADLARTRSELDATVLAVRTEVTDAYQRYLSAREEEEISATSVLAPARLNQGLLDDAFRSGKIDLSTLLLLRNELLDAELDYWDSWLELRLEFVRLTAVTAEPLPNQ
jgi:outer membrane protein, heavy metal efflux system